jgi:hypothetical protein
MPSSLAAALAASKANTDTTAEKQQQHAPAKSPASSLAQYQKKPSAVNTHKKPAGRRQEKQDAANKAGKSGGKSPQKQLKKQTDSVAAAEEIVFVCDIPSDSEEELDFDTLQISDHKSGGKIHGNRGSSNQRDRIKSDGRGGRNNHGGRLNVNASRRLIGHALGTRLDTPSSNGRESNQSRLNTGVQNNPGAMPTPWSKKAQEMKNETINNSRNGKQTKRMSNEDNRRDASFQPFVKDTQPSNSEVPVVAPKLESAKIKGRWADEDSSDDE